MTGYSIIYIFFYNIQPHYPSTRAVKAPELTDTATPIAPFTGYLMFFGFLNFTLFLTWFAVWFRCLPVFDKLPCPTSTRSGLACNCVYGGGWYGIVRRLGTRGKRTVLAMKSAGFNNATD